ncbi:hypothetical protein GGI35DRAFT_85673 [Trichoderma velutinum]
MILNVVASERAGSVVRVAKERGQGPASPFFLQHHHLTYYILPSCAPPGVFSFFLRMYSFWHLTCVLTDILTMKRKILPSPWAFVSSFKHFVFAVAFVPFIFRNVEQQWRCGPDGPSDRNCFTSRKMEDRWVVLVTEEMVVDAAGVVAALVGVEEVVTKPS